MKLTVANDGFLEETPEKLIWGDLNLPLLKNTYSAIRCAVSTQEKIINRHKL
jgi:hypothetical protein